MNQSILQILTLSLVFIPLVLCQNQQQICDFPKTLDGKDCQVECKNGQLYQIENSKKFFCGQIDGNQIKNLPQTIQQYRLSSQYNRYVKECYLINEISCKESNNECVKKLSMNFLVETCPSTIQQMNTFINTKMKTILDEQKEEYIKSNYFRNFMIEESMWVLKKIEQDKLDLGMQIATLIDLNKLSFQFFEKYEEFLNKNEDNHFKVKGNNIAIHIGYVKGICKPKINDFRITLRRISQKQRQLLSFIFFEEQQLCLNDKCQTSKFVMIQKPYLDIQLNRVTLSTRFGFRFEVEQWKINSGTPVHCIEGQISKTKIIEFKFSQSALDAQNKTIKCFGSSIVGIYYGSPTDQLKHINLIDNKN